METYKSPVDDLQIRITVEAIVYGRDTGAPNEDNDAYVVGTIAVEGVRCAVVPENVTPDACCQLVQLRNWAQSALRSWRKICEVSNGAYRANTYAVEMVKHRAMPKTYTVNTRTSAG